MPIIINLTVVYADWKEVWCNAEKRNWTITYFTSVLNLKDMMKIVNIILFNMVTSHKVYKLVKLF